MFRLGADIKVDLHANRSTFGRINSLAVLVQ